MKLAAAREEFLAPLRSVVGVVERLVATSPVSVQQVGNITVPGCRRVAHAGLTSVSLRETEETSAIYSKPTQRSCLQPLAPPQRLSTAPAPGDRHV
jgi:hypothetical protein